jgi:probable addiction module antidote protein
VKVSELKVFDPAAYLDDKEAVAAYLVAASEDGDPASITDALGVVARARGMSQLSRGTGLTRETLYKALSPTGNPSLSTLVKILDAFGLRVSFAPKGGRFRGRPTSRPTVEAKRTAPRRRVREAS